MAEETPGPADLELVNCSVTFLLLIILAVLLSLAGLLRQRQLLRAILAGEATDRYPDPYPLQRAAGAISVGALGFFFTLALRGWNTARAGDSPWVLHLSHVNLWASLLVLAAAILRLWALDAARNTEAPSEEAELPA